MKKDRFNFTEYVLSRETKDNLSEHNDSYLMI